MQLPQYRQRPWHEPIRFGTAVLWVASLSLWTFYQGLWFYCGSSRLSNSLSAASAILRTVRPLWFASFLPALAFGLAWYVFSHRLLLRTPAKPTGLDRLTISQTYASLCIAICAFTLNYRILPFLSFCTLGDHRASSHLFALTWDTTEWGPMAPVLEQQALIGGLAAAVAAMQAWGLLPRLGGNRGRLSALLALLLLGGCGAAWLGILEKLPSPAPKAVFELDLRAPAARGLLLDEEDHRDEANAALATYLVTHTDEGTVTPLSRLRRNWLPAWGALPPDELAYQRCELCQLPGVAVWTMTGLPLRLADATPTDSEPTNVIEVPRRPGYGRLYGPRASGTMKTMPIADLPAGLGGSDWVVAKIDFSVEMRVVRDLFLELREEGVRRGDLAVIPHGFRSLPAGVPVLSFEELGDTATYTPRKRPRLGGERIIVVRKYVPPRPRADTRPRCKEVEEWDLQEAWSRFALDPPGTLPGRVGWPVEADESYGKFVGILQGVLAGGAEDIVVEVHDAR